MESFMKKAEGKGDDDMQKVAEKLQKDMQDQHEKEKVCLTHQKRTLRLLFPPGSSNPRWAYIRLRDRALKSGNTVT